MEITNVCLTGNVRVLLLYLLYSDDNVLKNTYFFLDNIPQSIAQKLPHRKEISFKASLINNLYTSFKIRIWRIVKYPFLKHANYFGQDNILISKLLYPSCNMTLIEDGLLSYFYDPQPKVIQKYWLLRKLFLINIKREELFGRSKQVKKILLTGLFPIPTDIKNKVVLIDVNALWNKCSDRKKELIYNIFNYSCDGINNISYDDILLTQPLSEDGAISEEEKIRIYKGIVGDKKIIIKPHPREKTNYSYYFPDAVILKPYLPIELYSVQGVTFKRAYTIFSTAVFMLPNIKEIHFIGTKQYPQLMDFYGCIKYESGAVVGKLSAPK